MMTENNNQDVVATEQPGEAQVQQEASTQASNEEIKLSRADYDALKQHEATVGTLKRDLKNTKKELESLKNQPSTETKETPKNQTEDFGLLQKSYLAARGITEPDEVELAKKIQKESGVGWDSLPDSKYFTFELQALRDQKANAAALDVKGGGNAPGDAKNSTEYWAQNGKLPTTQDVPDRKKRAKILRELNQKERGGGMRFYNE